MRRDFRIGGGFLPWIFVLALASVGSASSACASSTEVLGGDAGEESGACPDCCEGCVGEVDAGTSLPPGLPSGPGGAGSLCVTSVDCAGDTVCGYLATEGCSAEGVCVTQTSGASGPPACGCDGMPVQYVATSYAGAPVESAYPCGDEGGVDAGTDAGDPGDAGSDADLDAEADADDAANDP